MWKVENVPLPGCVGFVFPLPTGPADLYTLRSKGDNQMVMTAQTSYLENKHH